VLLAMDRSPARCCSCTCHVLVHVHDPQPRRSSTDTSGLLDYEKLDV